ncbi:phospholipase D beta 1-like isoform X1 [Amaranthus tricolor]|uniref:phospholipase D beta 1-like isoform X1 n=1 Tax=Amaranthus tricolor TaxID=29722 RepID=UPI002590C768|nr:phospholipase D beta 1-like isoform X1 [Amaranthus tricolor]
MAHFGQVHSPSFDGSMHGQGIEFLPFQTCQGSLRVMLLHGHLDILVKEAKNLPNMDMFHKTLNDLFGGLSIKGMSKRLTSDPYVNVSIAGAIIARTFVLSNDENPVWMQHFFVPVAHTAAELHFVVKDDDVIGAEIIGAVGIPLMQLCSGARIEGTFPIIKPNSQKWETGAVLSLSVQYIPVERMNLYHLGVGPGPYNGVPGTYFPLRQGNRITLYQDAHVEDGMLPEIRLDYDMHYVHRKCWRDISDAISHARRLVYITGWSVTHFVKLVRDARDGSGITLGALLKAKAQEGVRVLLLVWDDPTSHSFLNFTTKGFLETSDEQTFKFFKGSSVQVILCPRSGSKGHSLIKQQEAGAIYSHHQKSVIVDADASQNRRKIIAFVGGLDLCDGRYDTPEHTLFRTLQTVHKDDYHQPNFTGPTDGCPREPWHDLHSQIDGPAAYDVLKNFQERWLNASKPRGLQKMKRSYDDHLLNLDKVPDVIGLQDAIRYSNDDRESWHVQVFRSIDSNSVKGFPKDPKDGTKWNLLCGKNVLIDMSIQAAYIHAIRSAQHYIYIENQYFLGSSYNWDSYKDLGANNLIPIEIALKIASKIRTNERFAAYIIIPMWPEGDPKKLAMQRILFWQYKTMQMMYEIIYKALEETGMNSIYEPQDFLNFFCLGNREASYEISERDSVNTSNGNTPQELSKKNRRFMIYVHSKGMIVDDEYVIIGSANINQRSMEGTRDTEIAMGAYQPHYTWANKHSNPRGQVYGYRMSLWAEHLANIEDCYVQPESLECVRRVRSLAEKNWEQFAADEVTEMKSHLLKYPLHVDRSAVVSPLPGSETFPDVGGKIMGSFIAIQENLTI